MAIVEISCVDAWREISELIDDALTPEMRERLELHLRHCAHCTAVYDGARNIVQLIGDDRILDLPSGFSERLLKRLSTAFCDKA